jgi:5-methylcytosine-specific restriction endonuclease McrA
MPETCALCGRPAPDLTEHHLIPRREHGRLRGRPGFDLEAARQTTVTLCVPCHATVHAELSSRELAEHYDTIEALRTHPGIARFVAFARRQDPAKRIVVRRPRRD